MTENPSFDSRIASLHYEYYDTIQEVENSLLDQSENIQCLVSKSAFQQMRTIPFGEAQNPDLSDYADGVDTMAFLMNI